MILADRKYCYWVEKNSLLGQLENSFLTSAKQVSFVWRNLVNYICREPNIRADYFTTYNTH